MTTTTQQAENQSWASMLERAISQPGIIAAAYSAFHNYSIGNQIAAMIQCSMRGITPGPIATYASWQAKGRQVRKGEKALFLCMPITYKRTEEKEDGSKEEHTFARFTWKPRWFVVSQTDGEAVEATKVPGWEKSAALATLGIAEGAFSMTNGNTQGYASGKTVCVSPVAAMPWKTLFHELAHVVLGHTSEGPKNDSETTPRDEMEMEAEGVAYLLCSSLGLPGSDESRGYIQSWGKGKCYSERMAQRVFSAAGKILKAGQPSASEEKTD